MKLAARERFLLGLLAVLLLVFGLRELRKLTSGGDQTLKSRSQQRSFTGGVDVDVAELRLDDLDRRTSKLVVGRDPFRFGVDPPPPAPVEMPTPRERPTVEPPPVPLGAADADLSFTVFG